MKTLAAVSWAAVALLATAGRASEISFAPIPAYSAEAQAVREGAAFRRQETSCRRTLRRKRFGKPG
jgi:hypothetical protein